MCEEIRLGTRVRIEYWKVRFSGSQFKFVNGHPISNVQQAHFCDLLCLRHLIRIVSKS